ncbi:uncharacterized protein LOC131143513 [Malania oleifera]|uniref:uncharacterized protein LOC131143513 n=1 Tax=Malania oleifera TaxID=397392 RepID=UPI0025AE9F0F|nr:uncharacterized protein LOC131143513 [Malania oleifera]
MVVIHTDPLQRRISHSQRKLPEQQWQEEVTRENSQGYICLTHGRPLDVCVLRRHDDYRERPPDAYVLHQHDDHLLFADMVTNGRPPDVHIYLKTLWKYLKIFQHKEA